MFVLIQYCLEDIAIVEIGPIHDDMTSVTCILAWIGPEVGCLLTHLSGPSFEQDVEDGEDLLDF